MSGPQGPLFLWHPHSAANENPKGESHGKRSPISPPVWRHPIVEEQGCSLWDVEYVKEAGTWYLRVLIDKGGRRGYSGL